MVGIILSSVGYGFVNADTSPPSPDCQPGGRYYNSSSACPHVPIVIGIGMLAVGLIIIAATIALWRMGKRTAWGGRGVSQILGALTTKIEEVFPY
jgi:hypothetical protein